MDLAKLRGRAQESARKVAESDGAVAARRLTASGVAKLGPHLREVIDLDDERPLTPETLLLKVVAAVHDDEKEIEISFKELRGTGKRNERLASAAGILSGGIGCVIADLYVAAALYWMLADCFDLKLSDADVAAHLLVAWGALPDPVIAHAVMDPEQEMTIAGEARKRFHGEVAARTKRDSVRTLWRLRSGLARPPVFDPSTFRDVFFAGRALQQRLDTAAMQLGLPTEDVRKPGFFDRR